MVDYDKILKEVSWRTDTGIVDFTKEAHINTLRTVLVELGYDSNIADSVTFNLKETAKKKKDTK